MMTPPRFVLLSLLLTGLLPASAARADVPPDCGAYDSLVTCDAASEGQPCAGGGTCYKFGCGLGAMMTASSVYKCFTCPTLVDDTAMVCQGPADFGKPCGKGGHCERTPPNCTAGTKYVNCLHDNPQSGGAGAGGAGGQPGAAGAGGAAAGAAGADAAGGPSAAGAGTAGSGASGAAGLAGSGASGEAGAGGAVGAAGASPAAAGAASGSPPAASDTAASSGCSLSGVGYRGALATLMTLAGAAAALLDRRRRR